jgi:hypothetical protein
MYKPCEALSETHLFESLLSLISFGVYNELLLALTLPATWTRSGTSSSPAFLQNVFKSRVDAGQGKPSVSCFYDEVDVFEDEGKLGERFRHVAGKP